MYGSRTNSNGAAITANGVTPILTGVQVVGNKIDSLEMAKDQNGNPSLDRAVLTFTQANGAKFTHSFWNSEEGWAQDQVNNDMVHICTKIVDEEEYYNILEKHGDGTFTGFIKAIATHIIPKAEGKTFTLKIIYKENKTNGKWFPNFPKYANYMELDGTSPSTLATRSVYDIYEMPVPTAMGGNSGTMDGSDSPEVVF